MFTDTCHPPGLSSNNCTIKNGEKSKGQVCQPCGIFPKRIEVLIYFFFFAKVLSECFTYLLKWDILVFYF